jgi:hypothetical protein
MASQFVEKEHVYRRIARDQYQEAHARGIEAHVIHSASVTATILDQEKATHRSWG